MSAGPAPGHRLARRQDGWDIDAWGPDPASCTTEALLALVESFAVVTDTPAVQVLPLSSGPGGPEDALRSVLEEVIGDIDVFSLVPVRFHLGEAEEEGGLAGDMEAVPADHAVLLGPAPKSVSDHDLSMGRGDRGWRCHAVVVV